MGDVPNTSVGLSYKSRRSSILKKSPSRKSLLDLDPNVDPIFSMVEDEGRKGCKRRVSFAHTYQVKEISRVADIAEKWPNTTLDIDTTNLDIPKLTISRKNSSEVGADGLNTLLSAPIVQSGNEAESFFVSLKENESSKQCTSGFNSPPIVSSSQVQAVESDKSKILSQNEFVVQNILEQPIVLPSFLASFQQSRQLTETETMELTCVQSKNLNYTENADNAKNVLTSAEEKQRTHAQSNPSSKGNESSKQCTSGFNSPPIVSSSQVKAVESDKSKILSQNEFVVQNILEQPIVLPSFLASFQQSRQLTETETMELTCVQSKNLNYTENADNAKNDLTSAEEKQRTHAQSNPSVSTQNMEMTCIQDRLLQSAKDLHDTYTSSKPLVSAQDMEMTCTHNKLLTNAGDVQRTQTQNNRLVSSQNSKMTCNQTKVLTSDEDVQKTHTQSKSSVSAEDMKTSHTQNRLLTSPEDVHILQTPSKPLISAQDMEITCTQNRLLTNAEDVQRTYPQSRSLVSAQDMEMTCTQNRLLRSPEDMPVTHTVYNPTVSAQDMERTYAQNRLLRNAEDVQSACMQNVSFGNSKNEQMTHSTNNPLSSVQNMGMGCTQNQPLTCAQNTPSAGGMQLVCSDMLASAEDMQMTCIQNKSLESASDEQMVKNQSMDVTQTRNKPLAFALDMEITCAQNKPLTFAEGMHLTRSQDKVVGAENIGITHTEIKPLTSAQNTPLAFTKGVLLTCSEDKLLTSAEDVQMTSIQNQHLERAPDEQMTQTQNKPFAQDMEMTCTQSKTLESTKDEQKTDNVSMDMTCPPIKPLSVTENMMMAITQNEWLSCSQDEQVTLTRNEPLICAQDMDMTCTQNKKLAFVGGMQRKHTQNKSLNSQNIPEKPLTSAQSAVLTCNEALQLSHAQDRLFISAEEMQMTCTQTKVLKCTQDKVPTCTQDKVSTCTQDKVSTCTQDKVSTCTQDKESKHMKEELMYAQGDNSTCTGDKQLMPTQDEGLICVEDVHLTCSQDEKHACKQDNQSACEESLELERSEEKFSQSTIENKNDVEMTCTERETTEHDKLEVNYDPQSLVNDTTDESAWTSQASTNHSDSVFLDCQRSNHEPDPLLCHNLVSKDTDSCVTMEDFVRDYMNIRIRANQKVLMRSRRSLIAQEGAKPESLLDLVNVYTECCCAPAYEQFIQRIQAKLNSIQAGIDKSEKEISLSNPKIMKLIRFGSRHESEDMIKEVDELAINCKKFAKQVHWKCAKSQLSKMLGVCNDTGVIGELLPVVERFQEFGDSSQLFQDAVDQLQPALEKVNEELQEVERIGALPSQEQVATFQDCCKEIEKLHHALEIMDDEEKKAANLNSEYKHLMQRIMKIYHKPNCERVGKQLKCKATAKRAQGNKILKRYLLWDTLSTEPHRFVVLHGTLTFLVHVSEENKVMSIAMEPYLTDDFAPQNVAMYKFIHRLVALDLGGKQLIGTKPLSKQLGKALNLICCSIAGAERLYAEIDKLSLDYAHCRTSIGDTHIVLHFYSSAPHLCSFKVRFDFCDEAKLHYDFVPIGFHVVRDGTTFGNLSASDIEMSLKQMNNRTRLFDYASRMKDMMADGEVL